MSDDPIDLAHQYRSYRNDTDAHFEGEAEEFEPHDEFEDVDQLMAVIGDYADAADHLRRFISLHAKRKGIPLHIREDAVDDAICEIAEALGRTQFDILLESIDMSDDILEVLRDSVRGKMADRAIDRALARTKLPIPTFTDVGANDGYDES